MLRSITCGILFFSFLQLHAQNRNSFGLQVGLSLQFGTHINKIGIGVNGYWLSPYTQVNVGSEFSVYANGLGPSMTYIENRTHAGIFLLAGKNEQRANLFYSPFFQQSKHNLSLGYTFLQYWDSRKTSQLSGAFALQISQFSLVFENDLFAGQGKDRFRTGYLTLYWKDSLNMANIGIHLWTGDPKGALRVDTSNYPARYGYKDMRNTPYGKYSNGILFAGYHRALFYMQSIGMNIGIDAEQVRNCFQNKLIHNAPWRGKKAKKYGDANYPMLTPDGSPYLYQQGQTIRKPLLYLEMGVGGT